MNVILESKNLNKTYKSKDRTICALNDLSFVLHQGETLGIVGESGCGKSTLLRVLCGLEKADSGQIFLRGEECTGKSIKEIGRSVQMIFQDMKDSFDPRWNMLRAFREYKKDITDQEIEEVLLRTGLSKNLLSRHPSALSAGQCQRMSIARALCSGAQILLCDEITSALDVTTQAEVVKLILELQKKKDLSILFVTHDIALAAMISDRIMVMANGCCVETGTTSWIVTDPENEYTKTLINNAKRRYGEL